MVGAGFVGWKEFGWVAREEVDVVAAVNRMAMEQEDAAAAHVTWQWRSM